MPGPNGTVVKKANAESVPEKKPGLDHAVATDPFDTAWMVSRPGPARRARSTLTSIVPRRSA